LLASRNIGYILRKTKKDVDGERKVANASCFQPSSGRRTTLI
jgi:hypothetical protein